jgi:hypothetical protein
LAHLLPKRFPIATADEMAKAIPPPKYVAPAEGEEALEELGDEFYDQELVVAKGSLRRMCRQECFITFIIVC